MGVDEFILVAIVVAAFLVPLVMAYFFCKRRNKLGLSILGVIWAGFTAILFFGMNNATGWDGLGYLMILLGVSAPAAVGGLIGSLVGWAKSDNEHLEQPSSCAGQTDTAQASR